jgi:DNA gyrase subunit A
MQDLVIAFVHAVLGGGAQRVEEGSGAKAYGMKVFGRKQKIRDGVLIVNLVIGIGIKNYMVTDKTGGVIGMQIVDGSEDMLLVTESGVMIRTAVDNVRTAGRATQGVIVMRFKEEGDRVIAMALTEKEEESAEEEGE